MSEPGQMGLLPEFDRPPAEALTQEQRYTDYMHSPQWRQLRWQALEAAGHRCQECGLSKWSVTLEVHHITYERFEHERLSDLIVLCEVCHRDADEKRRQQVALASANALEAARFAGWARKVHGDGWIDAIDLELASEQYDQWRERKEAEQ